MDIGGGILRSPQTAPRHVSHTQLTGKQLAPGGSPRPQPSPETAKRLHRAGLRRSVTRPGAKLPSMCGPPAAETSPAPGTRWRKRHGMPARDTATQREGGGGARCLLKIQPGEPQRVTARPGRDPLRPTPVAPLLFQGEGGTCLLRLRQGGGEWGATASLRPPGHFPPGLVGSAPAPGSRGTRGFPVRAAGLAAQARRLLRTLGRPPACGCG